ncbi:MAG: hypothetical protein D6719_12560 [Candidatus Dadabacteria bacterium]|nr:MAG: hypothetical protein D6719_12560 [Candidatus Dadabacteria bacterium]
MRLVRLKYNNVILFLVTLLVGCTGPVPGPDKQGGGLVSGAVTGAGAGAVTGFQLGVGTGAGALAGAGVGAVAGSIQGLAKDLTEEDLLALSARTAEERRRAIVHEILNDHYRRRAELHPTRDIYPADLFFYGDEVKLRPGADLLINEIARLNKTRMPWSRLVVASYVKASDQNSVYAEYLAEKRARAICDELTRAGIEPRRLEARGVIVKQPVLIDPHSRPGRYNQAIEIIPVDK